MRGQNQELVPMLTNVRTSEENARRTQDRHQGLPFVYEGVQIQQLLALAELLLLPDL